MPDEPQADAAKSANCGIVSGGRSGRSTEMPPRLPRSRNGRSLPSGRSRKSETARPAASAPPRPGAALAQLEDRTLRRLARGLSDVDARIDLHGMRQERAFSALVSFLRRAQARGARLVLVITGKGLREATDAACFARRCRAGSPVPTFATLSSASARRAAGTAAAARSMCRSGGAAVAASRAVMIDVARADRRHRQDDADISRAELAVDDRAVADRWRRGADSP